MSFTAKELAWYFDHTALKPEVTADDIRKLCAEASALETRTVCINAVWLPLANECLRGTKVVPITVVGFPLGACGTSVKAFEAQTAMSSGAREIDMVLSVGEYLSGRHDAVRRDIAEVHKVCDSIPLKVIFETSLLAPADVRQIARWCAEDGVAFVKTSTGFSGRGASIVDIHEMREGIASVINAKTEIKASGGIRTLSDAQKMIAAGATRLGASATVGIIAELSGASAVTSCKY